MKSKMFFGLLGGALVWASHALGATYTDAASNYPDNSWTNGSNGGTGFEAWSIVTDDGDGGCAGAGIWDSTVAGLNMGEAFGYVGKVGFVNIDRDFSQALNVGDSFALDFGVNWDSDGGNKGFSLFANAVEVINVNHGSYPGEITVNGDPGLIAFGTNTMRWTFTQLAANQISVYATGRDGVETFATTVTTVNAYGYLGALRLYSSDLASDAPDSRQSYVDNLTLEQEGTPPPDPVVLAIDGTGNPETVGDYEYRLTRTGSVDDDIVLSSDNEAVLTVPTTVSFATGVNTLVFTGTVVSLTSGPATILASNVASGAWTEYFVTPVAPSLAIDGEDTIYVIAPQTYTVTRVGAVGDTIVLSSSDTNVMTVPASATFLTAEPTLTFVGTVLGTGVTTLTASHTASGAWTEFNVTVSEPKLELTGPSMGWVGDTKAYTIKRYGSAADTVNLASSDTNVMTVPATVTFPLDEDVIVFQATALAVGSTTLSADNGDVDPAMLAVTVTEVPNMLAYDEAGNYTPEIFINTANEGYGFGAWDLWNTPATLGDSTAGGGGDLNSANGYSFQFMGDGEGGWSNGKRNFDGAMQEGDILRFTFTYNWDGGGRGVDIFCATGQFANVIDVSAGNSFKVNGTEISTTYSPGAVVEVEILQQSNGIQISLVRLVGGTPNLTYTTNILNDEPATGVSMYCGGYTSSPEDNVNYAIFMNDLQILGEERLSLAFTDGTWDPAATGDYPFELTRAGSVGDEILLTSDNTAAVTVPASVNFAPESNTVAFLVSVVSLTSGDATIIASNVASGVWGEYTVKPYAPISPAIVDFIYNPATAGLSFSIPVGYALLRVEGADTVIEQAWNWTELSEPTDYDVVDGVVTINTGVELQRMIRIWLSE